MGKRCQFARHLNVFRSVPNLQDICFKWKGTRATMWIKVNMCIGPVEHPRVEPGSWVRSPEWTAIYLALERLNCASDLGRPCHSIVWHAKDPSGRPEAKLSVELGGLERLGWWVRVLCDKYESTLLSPRANSHLYKPFGLNLFKKKKSKRTL